jgi:hypothetical protein
MATFAKFAGRGATIGKRSQLRLAMALVIALIALAVIGVVLVTDLSQRPAAIGAAEGGQDTVVFESYRDYGLRQLDAARSQSASDFESYRDSGLRQLDAARSQSASANSGFDCLLRNKIDDC